MDPSETLRTIREAAEGVQDAASARSAAMWAELLAENVQALDKWLTGKGFLPADWSR